MSDILSILTTISFVPSADELDGSRRRQRRKMNHCFHPKRENNETNKNKRINLRVKLTSFMSMVFCASARTTTFTLFLLAVLLIEDRDFCTTSFPRYPPKLDDDIVVVVNELAAANIVVVKLSLF